MYQLEQSPGRTVETNGKEYLFFSGYSYLGMGHVPEFSTLVKEGIDRFGLLHPSSRISNTRLPLYNDFEDVLSTLTGSEATVTFSSGYLAGKAITDLIAKQHKHVFAAPNTHSAIQCGTPLPDDWKTSLITTINQSTDRHHALFLDGVNPLTASVTNFSFLHELDVDKHLTCVIDDSHGIGLLGPLGNGLSYLLPQLFNVEFIVVYSLSKAFHLNGGGVSCSKKIAQLLYDSPYYGCSTAISPALAYAFINGQSLYLQQLQQLRQNIDAFKSVTADISGILSYPQLPIFILKDEWGQEYFDAHQIIISSFAYPDPSGNKVNRIVLNALHTQKDLYKLSYLLNTLQQDSF